MECDLDNVYEKIKALFPRIFGAISDDFKYVGGVLQQIPRFQSCEQFLKYLHPHLNEFFVLHSFMSSDDDNEYVLFRLTNRGMRKKFVMKVVLCDDKDTTNTLERDITFHHTLVLRNQALPFVPLGQTTHDFVLINKEIGLAFTVTKHFEQFIKNLSSKKDIFFNSFNQFMDRIMALHECRVINRHIDFTYTPVNNQDSLHLYNFSHAFSYEQFHTLLKKLYPKKHEYVTLYPTLQKYFFVFSVKDLESITPFEFRNVFCNNVFTYLKLKKYRIDRMVKIQITNDYKPNFKTSSTSSIGKSFKEQKYIFSHYPHTLADALNYFLMTYEILVRNYINRDNYIRK